MSLHTIYRAKNLKQFTGNEEIKESLNHVLKRKQPPASFLVTGPAGCVDKDTEFLSEQGWKKISEYTKTDKVLQWNKNTEKATFTYPLKYIKKQSEKLTYFHTQKGVDQCLSDDHRVLFYNPNSKQYQEKSFIEIKNIHEKNKYGFEGKFLSSFDIQINTKLNLTKAQLKVQVMFNADGSIVKNRKKCCLNFKKKRKIKRAEKLLNKAGIQYDKYIMKNNYVRFYFIPPLRKKEYTNIYYTCSSKQLQIISNEVLFWDGHLEGNRFYTRSKKCADFIQYVFTTTGYRASIYINDVDYSVQRINNKLVGITGNATGKCEMITTKSVDGYEYCFTVPTSYLILRRNNKIFITGNCGKTTLGRIIAKMLGCSKIDLKELNGAKDRGIGPTRKIIESLPQAPWEGKKKVIFYDEAHMLTKEAQEALLKASEKPPAHVHFIYCTTNPEAFKPTLKRRCHTYEVSLLSDSDLQTVFKKVLKKEKIEKYPQKILDKISELSEGSAGVALKYLDMVIDFKKPKKAIRILNSSGTSEAEVIDICRTLINNNMPHKAKTTRLRKLLKALKGEPESARRAILGYLHAVWLNSGKEEIPYMMDCFSSNLFDSGRPGLSLACIKSIEEEDE